MKWAFALLGCYAALIVTDVSGQPVGPIFKGQAVMNRVGNIWRAELVTWLQNLSLSGKLSKED